MADGPKPPLLFINQPGKRVSVLPESPWPELAGRLTPGPITVGRGGA